MNRTRFFTLAAAFLLSACASGAPQMAEPAPPPEPEHVDPTGEWELAVVVQGQPIDGIMTIEGDRESGYEGYIDTPVGAAAMLVEVDLDRVHIVIPDAGVEIHCVMTEDGILEGELGGDMGGGSFWAQRISGG